MTALRVAAELESAECLRHDGDLRSYQSAAALAVFTTLSRTIQPWHWVSTVCGEPVCLVVGHMRWQAPKRLLYPVGVCIYCGVPAWTKDHLLPVSSTGRALRKHVLTVPACGECNSIIGDRGNANIDVRRRLARDGIRRRYRRRLETKVWTQAELDELGPGLRPHVENAVGIKREVLFRLGWPEDPAYDLRAMELSGIENPYETGLLGSET